MLIVRDLKKTYQIGEIQVHALDGVSFTIKEEEFCVIVGASGAGKSTLLNILGGMDIPSEGEYELDGKKASDFNAKQLSWKILCSPKVFPIILYQVKKCWKR